MLRIVPCIRCRHPLVAGVDFCDSCLAMIGEATAALKEAKDKFDEDGDQEALLPVLSELTALLEG